MILSIINNSIHKKRKMFVKKKKEKSLLDVYLKSNLLIFFLSNVFGAQVKNIHF